MRRVLVTGASGFLGHAVIPALAAEGYKVRAAARRRPPQPPYGGGDIEWMQHPDLAEPFDWRSLLEGVDKIVHLAGIAHTGRGAPQPYDRVNRQATARLVGAAAGYGVEHFVFVSSIRAQSGATANRILTERDPATPTDDYGRSKLAAEAAVRSAKVPFTILRPVVLYGPGVKGNFALVLRAALSPWPLPVMNLTNRRSMLGVDNFVSALSFVLSEPSAIGQTYVVADPGVPPRLVDVITTLREAQGRRPFVLPVPPRCFEMPLRWMRRGDVWDRLGRDLQADPAKLIAAGWRPVHDTRSGLAALL